MPGCCNVKVSLLNQQKISLHNGIKKKIDGKLLWRQTDLR